MSKSSRKTETAIFGGGCFWCTEAIFNELKGVISVKSGYTGGEIKNPTYEQVSSGTSGHAEVTEIKFDPKQISYTDLLTVFFATHDPTTLNRQGHDVGPQYRSVIFYTTDQQKKAAEAFIKKLNLELSGAIVTAIQPFETFYEAEQYHQQYYEKNKEAPYCQLVINPKLKKLKEHYKNLLKN